MNETRLKAYGEKMKISNENLKLRVILVCLLVCNHSAVDWLYVTGSIQLLVYWVTLENEESIISYGHIHISMERNQATNEGHDN